MKSGKSFWKFFLVYFVSVAVLILSAGYFYFKQTSLRLLEREHFSLMEAAKSLKMGEAVRDDSIEYGVVKREFKDFKISNFQKIGDRFIKYVPKDNRGTYFKIEKPIIGYSKSVEKLKRDIFAVQFALLAVFAIISYFLAKSALKPLEKSIELLDRFSKDIIHDLNTPVTSMLLNLKLLKNRKGEPDEKILRRIESSAVSISNLHKNLNILLKSGGFDSKPTDISGLVADILAVNSILYPDIKIKNEIDSFVVSVNEDALRQILSNIVSNAFKHNKKGGSVKISSKGNTLIISDTGKGIKDVNSIFLRNYKEREAGTGIGLDIVKRLCDALKIDIKVTSSEKGSSFYLEFP